MIHSMQLSLRTMVPHHTFWRRVARTHSFWAPRTTTKTKVFSKPDILTEPHAPPLKHETFQVPPVLHRPKETFLSSLPDFDRDSFQFVLFDLETTGLKNSSEICQIAALNVGEDSMWSTYVLPSCNIEPGASLVTGLVVRYAGNDRYLTHHGKYVRAVPYRESIEAFYRHLQDLSAKAKHTILVGYCSKFFDVPILCNSFRMYDISGDDLDKFGVCFADSFSILKGLRKNVSLPSHKVPLERATLSHIYEYLFGEDFLAHNAVSDVKALSRILFNSPLSITSDSLVSQATTAGSALASMKFQETKTKLLNSMNGRLYSELPGIRLPISRYMASKIASSGLGYGDLEEIYENMGAEGIAQVCLTPVYSTEGKMSYRVTNNKEIINAIVRHFKENGH